ncbi:non-reducing polyketide synthase pks27 [Colletotrichum spaethianum]|uniref:Non-reducing polyketide synthase pks27 n=1 Tax=Colletotrichum spaethianum TaxID=700344 RepID=A0AA37P870_9PEZI|nr:non-reducing polyketide synthase pks27 [Colletotrichum spaethianum]GKT47439.1 non-reducing polyketide synthase pks27 [Colletotrichum spaethianum]
MSCPDQIFTYVFGDQTHDIADTLCSLVKTHQDPLVIDFIERSCGVLKHEVARLSPEQQKQCPRFATLADLISLYRSGKLNPCLVQALTCITQLGLFIRQHSSGCQVYPGSESSCLAGICTGALAAAAASCAHSAPSLTYPALHAVAVAVRLGALAWDVANRITNREGTTAGSNTFESWSRAVTGPSPKALADALRQYAADTGLPVTATPYISAVIGPNQATVSGPPAVLSDFFSSGIGKSFASTSCALRITAPYHSKLFYSELDIAQVLSGIPEDDAPRARIPIISTSTEGQVLPNTATLRDALEQAARDCLEREMALEQLPIRIAEYAKLVTKSESDNITEVVIQPFAFHSTERLVAPVRRLLSSDSYCVKEKSHLMPEDFYSLAANGALGSDGGSSKSPIAILAASGRFPGNADTMDEFWDILYNGVDTHEMVPSSRWNAAAHVGDTSVKNVSGTGFGCWLHQAPHFDAAFFNMSPREAAQVDPAQRLALLTAAEALEKAGIVPDRTPSTQKHRVGVWFGATSNDWMETNSAQNIDTYFIPGGNRAFIPGRINYHFKFSGPSYTIDTACSSSLAALHLACNALWRGEVDTAIVGGTNVLTNPDMTAGLDRGHFLSRTGNCKTFDDNADGYCRGEAVVTIILKRLVDAQKDKDPIEACILGVATNHNAEAESITRPHAAAQKELFEHILAETKVRSNEISYVEMHGTGTQAGDAGETTSVVTSLSPLTARGVSVRPASDPLYLGAVKSNVGHGEAAAGVTSLAKVLMMMKHSTIPPHIGIKTKINHRLPELQERNTRIATVPTPWLRPHNNSRRVLLNNFSAAGGNTAIVLEDAPPVDHNFTGPDPRRQHIVTISAKTADSLVANLNNLIKWLDEGAPQEDPNLLAKLSYTTTARRMHHRYRVAVMATSVPQLKSFLQKQLDSRSGGEKILPVPAKAPGFIFTFTGQGSPHAGMGADLYSRFASFRSNLQRYDHLCIQMGFPSILPLFERRDYFNCASLTCLQLAHVSFQMALCKLWESFGIKPKAVVGHSLGEYAALYAAGALSQADAIYLVGKRSQLMEQYLARGTHAMLVVMAEEATVLAAIPGIIGRDLEVSCRNRKHNIVLGGKIATVKEFRTVLESKGIRCHILDTAHAFHTSQVDPILAPFRKIAKSIQVQKPVIPVISPTKSKVLRDSTEFGDGYFIEHCRNPVNIMQAVSVANAEGVLDDRTIAVEIGPAPVVAPMVKEVIGTTMQTFASAHKTIDSWQLLTEAFSGMYLSGASIEWNRYHEDFPECQQVLQLPSYGWTLKEYWMQYTNDWSLRKGDAVPAMSPAHLAFSSIYNIVENTLRPSSDGEVVVDIDLNADDVHSMAQGHKVYGVPLCTPSVYADVAQMIGNYVKQITGMDVDSVATEVADMHIQSALIANDMGNKQTLRTEAKFDVVKRVLSCTFSTLNDKGEVVEQHANCQIRFVDVEATRMQFEKAAAEAQLRIKAIQAQVGDDDSTFRFSKSMIYKMVGQLADFDHKYRGLSAVTLSNKTFEATGTVSFHGINDSGKWYCNPAFLDSISQLAGFVMNANEGVDLEKELFVNHGWESMKLFTPKLDAHMTYYSYVKMNEGKDKLWTGDVIIFDQNKKLVGVLGGVALQGVPKRLMSYIINSAMKKVSRSSATDKTLHGPQLGHTSDMDLTSRDTVAGEEQAVENVQQHTTDSWPIALKILADEIGLAEAELANDVSLADVGVDSLLSLVICGRLRDELDIELPERALFEECLTVGDIRMRVSGTVASSSGSSASHESDILSVESDTASSIGSQDLESSMSPFSAAMTPNNGLDTPSSCPTPVSYFEINMGDLKEKDQVSTPTVVSTIPPAWSMYLQGSRARSKKTLFLFPDGCGVATSYLSLPSISPTTALVGFNSPFAKNPSRMYDHTLQDVLQSYIAGLRNRQAHGPYHLGGWSAGGILAFAVAQELIAAGEEIASLTLIDSPPPNNGLDSLPDRFYNHCNKVGIFRNEMRRGVEQCEPPQWLMPHFRASTELLRDYHAPAMAPEAARKLRVNIIWAGECAFDGVHYPHIPPAMMEGEDCQGMKFLTERRKDFGPGEWALLFPGASITTRVIEGEHHFSMMRGSGAERLVKFVRSGL